MHNPKPRTVITPPPPALVERTATSFDLADEPTLRRLGDLAHWLIDHHRFDPRAIRSSRELTRLLGPDGALIIVYHSGAVLVQGQNAPATVELLRSLAGGVQ